MKDVAWYSNRVEALERQLASQFTEARGALAAIAYIARDVEACKRWALVAIAALDALKETGGVT